MYKRDYYIHTYEVDATKHLQAPVVLRYFQDVMVHNVDSLGVSADFHKNQNLYWVLIDYEIDILDLPLGKQYVSCGTLPYSFKRVYGYRIWEMHDKDNNLLATGKGKFVLINIDTKEMVSLDQETISLYKGSKKEPIVIPFSKNKPFETY